MNSLVHRSSDPPDTIVSNAQNYTEEPPRELDNARVKLKMALQLCFYVRNNTLDRRAHFTQFSLIRNETPGDFKPRIGTSPAEDFPPLASAFRRRLLTSLGSASLVAVGANFAGITSFLLGFSPETSRNLKLDVVYPVGGYNRCLEASEGFEFVYPASWVRDQTLVYRAVGKAEAERSLDPPPLKEESGSSGNRRRRSFSEPVVAFGPPGSNGELNVSVIVSPVPLDFSIEAFGGAKEVGEAVVRTITGAGKRADVKGSLVQSEVREDRMKKLNYYEVEFRVESSSFRRHNVAVCCARNGRLYTLNAQAPESSWPDVKQDFYNVADSFNLITT